jgi:hypothetical protein
MAKATSCAALVACVALSLVLATDVLGASRGSPGVVASGHWDGHAWHLHALDQGALHCYRISVDFPFTRYAPPHGPNCAFSSHGAWNAFTVCPLAFVYGIADSNAATLRVALQRGGTLSVNTIARQGVKYFAGRIPCGGRVAFIDQLDAAGRVIALR